MISNNSIKTVMNKKGLRDAYRDIVCKAKISNDIFSLISDLDIKSICIYHPFSNEIKIDNLIEYLHKNNIKIFYPYMKKEDSAQIMQIREEGNIVFDDYHIKSSDGKIVDHKTIGAYLIPGIAFNDKGYRLGYGKGCYDKLLKNYKGIKIGACENKCILKDSFEETHDIKMDFIVTEDKIIKL